MNRLEVLQKIKQELLLYKKYLLNIININELNKDEQIEENNKKYVKKKGK